MKARLFTKQSKYVLRGERETDKERDTDWYTSNELILIFEIWKSRNF